MIYTEEYYTTGNYHDYLRRKFDALAGDLIGALEIDINSRIIDFGCGYGGLMEEFFRRGFTDLVGTDISQWAIEYGKAVFPQIADRLQYYNRDLLAHPKDFLLFLDVLEHMPVAEVDQILDLAKRDLSGYMAIRIPVSAREGEKYVLDVSNNDTTHINCHCRDWWLQFLADREYLFVADLQTDSIYSSDGVFAAIYGRNEART